jgi:hypothetical protein
VRFEFLLDFLELADDLFVANDHEALRLGSQADSLLNQRVQVVELALVLGESSVDLIGVGVEGAPVSALVAVRRRRALGLSII